MDKVLIIAALVAMAGVALTFGSTALARSKEAQTDAKADGTSCELPPDDTGIKAVDPIPGGDEAAGAPIDRAAPARREQAVFGLG